VDLNGSDPHLDQLGAFDDVGGSQRRSREPELRYRREETAPVLCRRSDEDIEVARETRGAVKCQRVRADDNELNRAGGQQRAELVEVGRQVQ
jgi:hypothetical protein